MQTFALDDVGNDDLVVSYHALIKLAQDGDLAVCAILAGVYQEILETPQGQSIARHLPRLKATLEPARPFSDNHSRLQFMAQCLSKQVSIDCCHRN